MDAYTLKVLSLDVAPKVADKPDVVVGITFEASLSDGEFTATYTKQTPIAPPTDDSPFTPFPEITPEQAEQWVHDNLYPSESLEIVDFLEDRLRAQREIAAIQSVIPPWNA